MRPGERNPLHRLPLAALALAILAGCSRSEPARPLTIIEGVVAESSPVVIHCTVIGHMLHLPVVINGHATLLLLDTGSDGLAIADTAVESLGLRYSVDRHVDAAGAFGRTQARCLETFTVHIPEVATLTLTHAIVGHHDPAAGGSRGLLGINVLGPLGAVIDTASATITFPRTSTRSTATELQR